MYVYWTHFLTDKAQFKQVNKWMPQLYMHNDEQKKI